MLGQLPSFLLPPHAPAALVKARQAVLGKPGSGSACIFDADVILLADEDQDFEWSLYHRYGRPFQRFALCCLALRRDLSFWLAGRPMK
jgi:hypothetical protein